MKLPAGSLVSLQEADAEDPGLSHWQQLMEELLVILKGQTLLEQDKPLATSSGMNDQANDTQSCDSAEAKYNHSHAPHTQAQWWVKLWNRENMANASGVSDQNHFKPLCNLLLLSYRAESSTFNVKLQLASYWPGDLGLVPRPTMNQWRMFSRTGCRLAQRFVSQAVWRISRGHGWTTSPINVCESSRTKCNVALPTWTSVTAGPCWYVTAVSLFIRKPASHNTSGSISMDPGPSESCSPSKWESISSYYPTLTRSIVLMYIWVNFKKSKSQSKSLDSQWSETCWIKVNLIWKKRNESIIILIMEKTKLKD